MSVTKKTREEMTLACCHKVEENTVGSEKIKEPTGQEVVIKIMKGQAGEELSEPTAKVFP